MGNHSSNAACISASANGIGIRTRCRFDAASRANRVAAAPTATQNMTLNDVRRLAWLAEKQDYRWDLLVSLVRSVLDNVSTVEMEHPDPLSNFL